MTRSYQRKTSEQWLALVNEQTQSNLSGAKFCDQHDISYASFCKWKQRFSRSQELHILPSIDHPMALTLITHSH